MTRGRRERSRTCRGAYPPAQPVPFPAGGRALGCPARRRLAPARVPSLHPRIGGRGIDAFKVFLFVGLYVTILAVSLRAYRAAELRRAAWDIERGAWSVLGGLVKFPFALIVAPLGVGGSWRGS